MIKYVDNHFNNDKNIKILIPNALDGLHILCAARRGFKLDCYETQDEFINGGIIDNFNIIDLKEKLNYFNYNDKVNLYEKNFFEQKNLSSFEKGNKQIDKIKKEILECKKILGMRLFKKSLLIYVKIYII